MGNSIIGDTWKIGIKDAANRDVAQIIFDINSASQLRLRASTTTNTGANYRNFDYPLVQTEPVSLGVEFDFDNGTVRYLVNGSEAHAFTGLTATDISGLVYTKGGAWTTAASSVSLSQMGLYQVTAVPEPAIMGAIAGLGVLVFVCRQRHRKGMPS